MSLLHDTDDSDLEEGVRTMLRRLAADVHEAPPAWDDLIKRHGAAGPPLRLAEPPAADPARRAQWRHRPRTSLVAAAVVAVAVAGALVVDRGTSDSAELPAAESINAISPSDPAFDAEVAAAVWATDLDDPVAAASAYLEATGVPTDASLPGAATAALVESDSSTATVEWSLVDAPEAAGGTVFLRAPSAQDAHVGWTVVGSAATDVALDEVRYDGERLAFTVARTAAPGEQLAVGVWVDGLPVSLGGQAVAQAGAADVSLGELVDIGADVGAEETLGLPVAVDDIVTLRVAHVVEGRVVSVTQMVVELPEAGASAGAGVAGPAEAGATGSVDAAPGGADVSAEGGAAVTPPGSAVPLPDTTDLTLPTIPGVPTLPPLLPLPSLPPVATTLPAPPTDIVP